MSDKVYLIVFPESGGIFRHSGKLPQELLDDAGDGDCDIVDITDSYPTRYWDRGWIDVEKWDIRR